MSNTMYKNYDVRLFSLGLAVDRATAQLPQGATADIFAVTGGNIILTQLVGEVTTALGAVATTIKAISTPAAAGTAATDLCAASADQTGATVGTHYSLPADKATGLVVDGATRSGYPDACPKWLVPPGKIRLTVTGNNVTGRVKWTLCYIPLDDAARVVAA